MSESVASVDLPNGVTLPYVEQGDASGAPVVLLHGLADSWRSFELVLAHLPRSIRAFAPTQRGHGDATRPETGYHLEDYASDAAAFMDALGIDAAVLAGHSSHSLVVQRLAIDLPDRVVGLVLIGAPTRLTDNPRLRELYDSTISKLTDPIDPAFVQDFQGGATGPVPQGFFEAQVRESLKIPARVWKQAFGALLEDDLSQERSAIKAPTLLVWGDRDGIVTRADQDELLRAIPASRLIAYEGVGHSPHWENPARLASDLEAFAGPLCV